MTPNYFPFYKMKLKIKLELTGLKTFSFNLIYFKILIISKSFTSNEFNIIDISIPKSKNFNYQL